MRRLASGNFKPSRTFPLAEIVEAHRYMESNAQIGKIVVTVCVGARSQLLRSQVRRWLALGGVCSDQTS